MSKAVAFRRQAKGRRDRAVSQVYRELAGNPRSLARFAELLRLARERSSLLKRPTVRGLRVLEVDVLRNLASFDANVLRPADHWSGVDGSGLTAIGSLAQHLFSRYPMPKFLASAWFGDDSMSSLDRRRWFVAHARGARFRELDLPIVMTRRMERLFLGSPDHLSIEQAMRRAELMGLDADPHLVDAVLATRLGHDLAHGDFWRTFLEFLVRFESELAPNDVGPMVDFLQFVRHEAVEIRTEAGVLLRHPPQPNFSLKGRTPASLLRLVDNWHEALGRARTANLSWEPSRYRPMVFESQQADPDVAPTRWELVELTNSEELRLEGAALRHCVRTYAYACLHNTSRIWSLRRWSSTNKMRSILTIQVDPRTNQVIQARGYRNSAPSPKARSMLLTWARTENLRVAV